MKTAPAPAFAGLAQRLSPQVASTITMNPRGIPTAGLPVEPSLLAAAAIMVSVLVAGIAMASFFWTR